MTGPYAQAAEQYWAAGWRGILPLPYQRKADPPAGFTGRNGADTSWADCFTWLSEPRHAAGNIALRLPRNILGVDVDNYGEKKGAATLAAAEARWGPLPLTWRTTSRDDGTSGIQLFRIPEGLEWPGELGPGTELIQHGHRYAVAPPSIHPEGRTYRWISPAGIVSTTIPDLDTLPPLPDTWVEGLTGGQLAREVHRNNLTTNQAQQYLVAQPGSLEQPCARMSRAISQARTDITTNSAHNGARDGALRVIRLADEGHTGLLPAITELHNSFIQEATSPARDQRGEHRRTTSEAAGEWNRIVESAVNLVTADPTGATTCDCGGALTALTLTGPAPTAGNTALNPEPAPADQPAADRTTWWPRDLAGVLSGEITEPAPDKLTRTDGISLFYRGKVNGLLGESESGKTWVALLAVLQALRAGQTVIYLDFEDTPAGIIGRLRALGATNLELAALRYVSPEETLHAAASNDLQELITAAAPDLIVLDGFNAAMTLLGLDINDNGDATKFSQMLLRPLSASGAAVIYVDHVPKNKDNRGKGGIGAQAKRAMTTGCALLVDIITPFGRGMQGRLQLTVDKDRPGFVRQHSEGAKDAGTAILESDENTGGVAVRIHPPDLSDPVDRAAARHAQLMEAISTWLASSPERTSLRACREAVPGRSADVDAALVDLIAGGFVRRFPAGRGSFDHELVREWTVAGSLAGWYDTPTVTVSDRVPDTDGTRSGGQADDRVPSPPPYRGGHGRGHPDDSDPLDVDHHTGEIRNYGDWYDQ